MVIEKFQNDFIIIAMHIPNVTTHFPIGMIISGVLGGLNNCEEK